MSTPSCGRTLAEYKLPCRTICFSQYLHWCLLTPHCSHAKNELKYLECFRSGYTGAFDMCTWLSTPRHSSMKKNRGAHNREKGIVERASGYTTKIRPGPALGHGEASTSTVHEKSGHINRAVMQRA